MPRLSPWVRSVAPTRRSFSSGASSTRRKKRSATPRPLHCVAYATGETPWPLRPLRRGRKVGCRPRPAAHRRACPGFHHPPRHRQALSLHRFETSQKPTSPHSRRRDRPVGIPPTRSAFRLHRHHRSAQITDRCAKKVKSVRASIRPGQRRIGPNEASGAGDRRRGGTARATLPGPGTPGCASPRS